MATEGQGGTIGTGAARSAGAYAALSARVQREIAERYDATTAASLGVSREAFAELVAAVVEKYSHGVNEEQAIAVLATVRLEDLVLARACAAGHDGAWELFLTKYRETLYSSARAIAKEESAARDLADSLYAELYGMNERDGRRVSKLDYYMGRGSLEGWLRTVLAQEFVNRYRKNKRLTSLEEDEEEGMQFVAPEQEKVVAPDARLGPAVDEALKTISEEDKYILAAYYLDGHKLAEIAQVLRVHQSTISRKLERLARDLQVEIRKALVGRGLSAAQAEELLEVDVRDVQLDLRNKLRGPPK